MTAFTESLAGIEITGPELEEADVITDVVIISRVMRPDRKASALVWHASEQTDAIVQLGLMSAAKMLMEAGYLEDGEDE